MPDGTAERISSAQAPVCDGRLPAAPQVLADDTGLAGPARGLADLSTDASVASSALVPAEPPGAAPGPPDRRQLAAARLRLASRYRISDAQTPQELRARLIRDARAISAVIAGAQAGQAADPLDIADALVLIRSLRSYLDGLEAGLLDGAEQAGLSPARVAACLGLTVSEMHHRHGMLKAGRPG